MPYPSPRSVAILGTTTLYQLFVQLDGIERHVWRRLLVSKQTELPLLHLIMQEVMGWRDYHLHRFEVGDGVAFAMPSTEDYPPLPIDYRYLPVEQIAPHEGARFRYVYDYGDNWVHEITVENRRRPIGDRHYPVVLEDAARHRPRTSAESVAIMNFLRSWPTQSMRNTSPSGHGQAIGLTRSVSISRRSIAG